MSAAPARAFMTIGEVLAKLRLDFPDVTISKIRFLESEGLVEPERTPSGYRKFTHADIERLRYVLFAQRDHYLPLRVIKERLDAIDQGRRPPGQNGPREPRALVAADDPASPRSFEPSDTHMSREELLEAAGIDREQLRELEGFGLVRSRGGSSPYDGDALVVAKAVAELRRFGLEPRHLRAFKRAADREVGLIEQIVAPLLGQRGPQGRARADEVAREIAALSVKLHAGLVKTGLGATLGR